MKTTRLFALALISFVLIGASPAIAVEWTGYTRETDQVGGLIADGVYDGVFNYDYAGQWGLGSVKHYIELLQDAQQIGVDGEGNPLYEYIFVHYCQPKSGYNIKQFILGFDNDQIVNIYDIQGLGWCTDPKWARTPMEFYANTMATSGDFAAGIIPNWFAAWDPNTSVPWAFDIPDGLLDHGEMFYSNHAFPGPLMDAGDTIDLWAPAYDYEAPVDEGMLFVFPAADGFDYGGPGWSWMWRIVTTQRAVDGDITWSTEPGVDEFGNPVYSHTTILGRFFEPEFDPGDFDGDGDVDVDDINALCANMTGDGIPLPPGFEQYDLDNDGDADSADMDILIHDLVETTVGVGTEYGDFNLDGKIDTVDLTILGTYFGVGTSWSQGNANCDTTVDTVDLTILGTYFGFVASSPIPEPATMSLLALGGIAALRRRRK